MYNTFMHQYTIIPLATAKQILKVLKNKVMSTEFIYESVNHLFPLGHPAMIDMYGVSGVTPGSLVFEGSGHSNEWKQVGLNEEHWLFGEADPENIGYFLNNTGGQFLTVADMIRLVEGHIESFKKQPTKPMKKVERTLADADREIARLQKLLKSNGIKF